MLLESKSKGTNSLLPSALAAAAQTSGREDKTSGTTSKTAARELLYMQTTNRAQRGTSSTKMVGGNWNPNILDDHVSLSDLQQFIPTHLRDHLGLEIQ